MDYSVYADWTTIVFFLWFGLKKFIPALDQGYFQYVGAVVALLLAAFLVLDNI